jgi:glutamine amidotransferase
MFALRANRPTRVAGSLLTSAHSLRRQSGCDLRGRCHECGWGIGSYLGNRLERVRSPRSAKTDSNYERLAGSVVGTTVLGHVRLASTGSIAEVNSHPFVYGKWLFAHNGTLFGFAEEPARLRELIPEHLRARIEGMTDSEHLFYFLLGRLEHALGKLDGAADAEVVGAVLAELLAIVEPIFPGKEERSQFNCVLTDGQILAASRWRRGLWWLERDGNEGANGDGPVEQHRNYRAVAVASEPTTEERWEEVPEQSVLVLRGDLTIALRAIG